jgi:hypothetical protein
MQPVIHRRGGKWVKMIRRVKAVQTVEAGVEREADKLEPNTELDISRAAAVTVVEAAGLTAVALDAALNAGQVRRSAKQGNRWHISPSGLREWIISQGGTP